jgi:hypothetical protein
MEINQPIKKYMWFEGLSRCLVGQPAIEALHLVQRIGAVEEKAAQIEREFPDLFNGLGKMRGSYTIQLQEGVKPHAVSTPRRVPIPLMGAVKVELQRMEEAGVITQITEPTEWCAGMVVVPKKNNKIRICVDLTKLNESVKRERHPLPAVDESLGQLAGATVFTKLDANSGFWQVPLSEESARLTTFITPFGRFCFHRLPFGITSAPEHFQRRMEEILQGLEGVICRIDDTLIHGRSQEEHDERLHLVLHRLVQAGVTLNKQKCQFSVNEVKFLGHIINSRGVCPDPDKIAAVKKINPPTEVSGVRRLLGTVNQLGKFIPNLAAITQPIRDLLIKGNHWTWGESQQVAFDKIKEILTSPPTLAFFNPNYETLVSADASSFGLGAVLLQKKSEGEIRPVAFISRAMSSTESRYAQIEREALAFTWACERLSDYLIGIPFHIQTDHKPLIPLFSTKRLEDLTPRLQRFRMRMMRYDYTISHVPGKQLITADMLSRAPVSEQEIEQEFCQEVETFIQNVVANLPASEARLEEISQHQ